MGFWHSQAAILLPKQLSALGIADLLPQAHTFRWVYLPGRKVRIPGYGKSSTMDRGDGKSATSRTAFIWLSGGPTSVDHGFKKFLRPGESFTSITTALGRIHRDVEAAFGALTQYRRKIMRPHEDNEKMLVIFNDYINCLMGGPDEDKIKALLDPVAQSGADYFVIDAGWYSDDSGWWDDVGLWEPSKSDSPLA